MRTPLLLVVLLFTAFIVNAQKGNLRIGPHIGLTTGYGETLFVFGGDLDYLFEVDDKFEVGVATGLSFITRANVLILPLAGAGRFNPTEEISIGLDLGYGIGINKSGNGFYFRPIFGYNLDSGVQLRASYSGIGDSGYFNVGAMFDI